MSIAAPSRNRKSKTQTPKSNFNPPALVTKYCTLCGVSFDVWEQEGRPERATCYECDPVPGEPQGDAASDAAAASAATKKTAAIQKTPDLIEIVVDVRKIEVRAQARKAFDEAKIEALAETIRSEGLLQPPVVRHNPGNDARPYVLVAGERRLRAVKLLGWEKVNVRLASGAVDDAQALLAQGLENLAREDLNDVEMAQWCKLATSPAGEGGGGLTQEQLAGRLGVTQAEISNRIRLLRSPAWALELVISGQMSRKHAMELLAFEGFAGILMAIEKDVRQRLKQDGELGTTDDFRTIIHDTARRVTAPLEDSDYRYELGGHIRFAIAADDLKALDTVTVRTHRGDEMRAIDKKAAEKLLAAAKKEAIAAAEAKAKKKGKGKAAAGEQQKLTPAEQKKRDAKLAKQHAARVEAWFYDWLRVLCATKIKCDDATSPAAWLATWAMVVQPAGEQEIYDLFFAAIDKGPERGRFVRADALELIASLSDGEVIACQVSLAVGLLVDDEGQPRQPSYGCEYLRSDVVAALARLLKLDVAAAWRDDRASAMREKFWSLHSKEQLLALGAELKVPLLETQKKSVMVNLLTGQQKPLALPKSLAPLVAKVAGKPAAKAKKKLSRRGAE